MDQTKEEKVTEPDKLQTSDQDAEKVLQQTETQMKDLQTALLDKAAEIEALHDVTVEQEKKFASELGSLQAKVEELQKALESANKEKEEAVSELNKIREEALLSMRLARLREANLLRKEEEAQIKQTEKIRNMSDETFEEYFNELLEVKSQVLAEAQVSKGAANDRVVEEITTIVEKLTEEKKPSVSDESDKKEETETAKKESAACKQASVDELVEGFSKIVELYRKK